MQAPKPIYAAADSEIARGYLLISVFYVHSLYGVIASMGDPMLSPAAGVQLKLLAPEVAAFFFLNGMSVRNLGEKTWRSVVRHSVMLIVLAAASHAVGAVLDQVFNGTHGTVRAFLRALLKPLVYGTGYVNYIAWFLVVLAVARLFIYAFQRSKMVFVVCVAVSIVAIFVGQSLRLPDNLYEWRNWPAAVIFMLIGMRMPPGDRIPDRIGYAAIPVTLVIGWFNSPTLLTEGPCLACSLTFVAQPMVGQYGSAFVYLLQQLAFIVFLWWVSARFRTSLPSQVARYFGSSPLQMLILHGWVLIVIYPAAARGLPKQESGFLFFALLASIIMVHVMLFQMLRPVLDRFLILASKVSHLIIRPSRRKSPTTVALEAKRA